MTPPPAPNPDPMKGVRGVFAATLVLESIVVLLGMLVLTKFGAGATPAGVAAVLGLAAALIVAAGLQRRPWGLCLALALQAVMIALAVFVPVLGAMGVVFALVWSGLLLMRRDVARKMERGELPAQRRGPDRGE
ncbi:DUF4233 domain-containing protein [Pseudonocardia asaccharolytica]|uniref:Membrane protein n=1 Tax=Pseudonocardia asaccharolytica DSM 44247 = NBRC 16224 TaxID=1123024 RepID=A0A511CW64_9PSEU|nr:DUF4233 domain-containing protein [Pseudonocardia asaccharolytica]GEL16810.1 membrane protein [Pseudonocardia asaccharolytica DSM 44247 = NBRC 16224]